MTLDDAVEAVEEAKLKAHAEARKLLPGMAGQTSTIVNAVRLHVIEMMLASLMANNSQLPETIEVRTACELRDYWECVAEEIAK